MTGSSAKIGEVRPDSGKSGLRVSACRGKQRKSVLLPELTEESRLLFPSGVSRLESELLLLQVAEIRGLPLHIPSKSCRISPVAAPFVVGMGFINSREVGL